MMLLPSLQRRPQKPWPSRPVTCDGKTGRFQIPVLLVVHENSVKPLPLSPSGRKHMRIAIDPAILRIPGIRMRPAVPCTNRQYLHVTITASISDEMLILNFECCGLWAQFFGISKF